MSVAIKKLDGVASVEVSLDKANADIRFNADNTITLPQLRRTTLLGSVKLAADAEDHEPREAGAGVFLCVLRKKETLLTIFPAVGARQLIAFIDIEFVDFDLGVAFGTGGHSLDTLRGFARLVGNWAGHVPESETRKFNRALNYSEKVRRSATQRVSTAAR